VATVLLALLLGASVVGAQDEPIADNSFLIEEAYNQESGVVQHINAFSRDAASGDWVYTFTRSGRSHGLKHQISYSLPVRTCTRRSPRRSGSATSRSTTATRPSEPSGSPSRLASACSCRRASRSAASARAAWACSSTFR
jgi:hypothetical protein